MKTISQRLINKVAYRLVGVISGFKTDRKTIVNSKNRYFEDERGTVRYRGFEKRMAGP
jgi:hypothetical protein